MGHRGIWLAGLVVALVVGFGVGWVVFGAAGDDTGDADLACAGATQLPDELGAAPVSAAQRQQRLALYSRTTGVGLLAQAAGQDGPGHNDLDELGQAGRRLESIVQRADPSAYSGAVRAIRDACDAR